MQLQQEELKQALLEGNYVSEEDLNAAPTRVDSAERLQAYLLERGLITSDLLGQAVAEWYDVPYADLNSHQPTQEQVRSLPKELGMKYRVVVFAMDEKVVTLTTDDPKQGGLVEEAQAVFPDHTLQLHYSLSADIDVALRQYRSTLDTRFNEIIQSEKRVAPEIIDEIISDAIAYNASDIHFEPREEHVLIRFRIDGVLHEAGQVPIQYYESMLNRIKVQAHLRIDEHFSAQDGAIRYENNGVQADMRVSIAPTITGEKVTIRLLTEYVRSFTMADLGLSAEHQELLLAASRKPFGMILVAGPTGSGKTTTMYAVLKQLNRPETNVTTIEDPVEYRIEGVNQIQVNTQTNITFAAGLRSIVRQDPDVILVGEIRDPETAEIGINAALTGHLLLSTFHANDAATSIPRLLDMGVEPFLLSSTLELLMAQRLVRKICETCRVSQAMTPAAIAKQYPEVKPYFKTKTTLYRGDGCSSCGGTGFRGRTAIYEFIPVTPAIQDLIMTNPSTQSIWKLAREEGAVSLFEDGLDKVRSGQTTIEELFRVATPPE